MPPDRMNAKAIRILLCSILISVFAYKISIAYEIQALDPDSKNFITETDTTETSQPVTQQQPPAESPEKYSTPTLTSPPISAPSKSDTITTDRVVIQNEELQKKAAAKEFKVELKGYRYFKYRG